jgi:hypothetical protein
VREEDGAPRIGGLEVFDLPFMRPGNTAEDVIVQAKLRTVLVISPDLVNRSAQRVHVLPFFSLDNPRIPEDLRTRIMSNIAIDSILLPGAPQMGVQRDSYASISLVHAVRAQFLEQDRKIARLTPDAASYVMGLVARYFGLPAGGP